MPGVLSRPLDWFALIKPSRTLLVVITTLGGLYLAPVHVPLPRALLALLGTTLVVAAANTLNQYLERDIDGLMRRTRNRPLPAGRVEPRTALWLGAIMAAASLPVLAFGVNLLTAALAAIAIISYVLVYTPMKRRSTASLAIGAIPGAIPPLMGWTAAMDRIDLAGTLLFAVLFVWQLPHFLAISIYAAEEFQRAGIKVLSLERGALAAKRQIALFSAALLPLAVSLAPIGVAGPLYFWVALAGGVVFLTGALLGLRHEAGTAWAKRQFLGSLLYLTALFVVLAVEGPARG